MIESTSMTGLLTGLLVLIATPGGAQTSRTPRDGTDVLASCGRACQPGVLPTFGARAGTIRPSAVLVHDDGGGPALHAAAGGEVARWDGSYWVPLGDVLSGGVVRTLAVFDDGTGAHLYAGGSFSLGGGLARWDGVAWSAVGGGLTGSATPSLGGVYCLEVLDLGAGPVLGVGGAFDGAGGASVNGVATWNGTTWTALGGGVSPASPGDFRSVNALEVFDDGAGPALFVGGDFTHAGGVLVRHIAKWDGASWSSLGGGLSNADAYVTDLEVFDDGSGPSLYMAGHFTHVGSLPNGGIARWDGVAWTSVGGGTSSGTPRSLERFDDGSGSSLFLGGDFTLQAADGQAVHIARWDGSSWWTVGGGTTPGSEVFQLAVLDPPGGSGPGLYATGRFIKIGDLIFDSFWPLGLAYWDGLAWRAFERGPSRYVLALAARDEPGGPALYAGGAFKVAAGASAGCVARWDGTAWSTLASGLQGPSALQPSVQVNALELYDDGGGSALFAGGRFTSAAGVPIEAIARWDGVAWQGLGGGLSGGNPTTVLALAVHDNGLGPELYAGGDFSTAEGSFVGNIARWDGSTWSPAGAGTSGDVRALVAHDDGSGPGLFVGGTFQLADGQPASGLAKWSSAGWSPVGVGFAAVQVTALAVHDDGLGGGPALYVGGAALTLGGSPIGPVARWDGTSWSAVGPGGPGNPVSTLVSFDDGGGPRLIAQHSMWDGTSWIPSVFPAAVTAGAPYDDGTGLGETLVVGTLLFPGVPDGFLTRWGGCPVGPPSAYCAGKPNSVGCIPFVSWSGVPSASCSAPFEIRAHDVVAEVGNILYSFKKANLAFHGGRLCVKAPIQRLPLNAPKQTGSAPCPSTLTRDFNTRIQSGLDPLLTPGQTVFAQWRQRDLVDPQGFGDGLTNGIRFTIAP